MRLRPVFFATFISTFIVGVLVPRSYGAESVRPKRQPNLIVILADDLGYETVGANGGTSYQTPVLDALAAHGARFTQCYAQPLCTPTRAQIMTGQYNVRNYVNFGNLNRSAVTFANLLKNAGYATAVTGKWQLGRDRDAPKRYGFDEHYLWQLTRKPPRYANPGLEINGVEKDFGKGEYGPDIINAHALDFVTRKKDVPFFLYYPMILPHDPYQPTPDSKNWDPALKGEKDGTRPEYVADMITYMDKLVGKLVNKLDSLGIRDDTLLIFLGDNGTGKKTISKMGKRVVVGGKGSTTTAGMHVPCIADWRGQIVKGKVYSDLVDTTDILPTLLDAAGVAPPTDLTLDGHSFLPLLRGQKVKPRDWIYSWYSPRHGRDDKTVREFAFTSRFKLYRSGEFFDLRKDPDEKRPLLVSSLKGEAAVAAKSLQGALARFDGARPVELD